MTNVPNYDPAAKTYSELHESRLVVRVTVISDVAPSNDNVGYWDSLQGGQASRTVSPRKQPGKGRVVKVPGIHQSLSQVTLSRAWNSLEEHRVPVHGMIKGWLNNPLQLGGLRLGITQMILKDDGTYKDYDYFEGPLVSYEGPKGNSEGEGFVKEQIVIDPDVYNLLDGSAQDSTASQGVTRQGTSNTQG